jgi:hypothetical protein
LRSLNTVLAAGQKWKATTDSNLTDTQIHRMLNESAYGVFFITHISKIPFQDSPSLFR